MDVYANTAAILIKFKSDRLDRNETDETERLIHDCIGSRGNCESIERMNSCLYMRVITKWNNRRFVFCLSLYS
jgi:hypothetical protein